MNQKRSHWGWPTFLAFTILVLWVTHAIAFFAHEYAHSAIAWILGWKTNPLALNYGHPTVGNLLAMLEIDENVDYAPIFAGGHGREAGLIAAAGAALGNGILSYGLSRWGFAWAWRRCSLAGEIFFYWLCVMSIGNFIDYVPVRTFSYREDMHTVAMGFACSPWWILLVLGIPFGIALVHFFWRFSPQAVATIAPASSARRGGMALLTAFTIFVFFGLAGWSDSGIVSHRISLVCITALFPGMAIAGWLLANRNSTAREPMRV